MQCEVHAFQKTLGKKWTILILEELNSIGHLGFGELLLKVRGITTKILAQRLSDLEKEGIIDKAVVQDSPLRVKYGVTEKGRELVSIFVRIKEWAVRHSVVKHGTYENCNSCPYKKGPCRMF